VSLDNGVISGFLKIAGIKSVEYFVGPWASHHHTEFICILAIIFIAFFIFITYQIIKALKMPKINDPNAASINKSGDTK